MESPVPKDTDGIDDDASSDDEDESTLGVSMLTLNDPSDNGGDSEDDPMQRFFDMLYKEYPMQVAKQISRVHIHHIFVSLPASHASRRQDERRTNGYLSSTLVYGEIDFRHFRTVFTSILKHHDVLTKPGGVFLDIGCGSGRPVFAAALLHDFDECVGVEILDGLAQVAADVATTWHREKKDAKLSALKKRTRIVIHHGDATAMDWPSADFIFCNSTCFDERLMLAVSKHAIATVKKGGVVVTATKPLVLDTQDAVAAVALVSKCKMQESWGPATLYIYKRG
ncbi:hypothetical protein DYB30_010975 [Aphanomyces astaci]|uniref:Histone-lysine N-methyltransferase, H3 lysine-79 specific n=1 Tax=Aphanomyces astaci TaxID=112090 RepID=A0A397FAI6_APHAT|nr:hypothetical protein DYB38_006571 [Aphanomyces astaci]RHY55081.1 hypothetical protein DYB30_010975 [Aphanomyces astaci]RHZ23524.1 hypothetical protein DYB31_011959 [Aphanomyces astaci]RHZ23526.1 hypothetical protein DYB31_008501 [Aphanomyces astaci]RQM20791.1 hypothetical protein B5M09_003860 [Aphanomyces astaci]